MSDLIQLHELQRLLLEHQSALAPITLAPGDALGFVLATPVIATASLPSFVNSAMDGYALRSADTTDGGRELRVVGATMAGEQAQRLAAGEAIRIMTGAPIPAGADAVITLEESADGSDGSVQVPRRITAGTNVRLPGEDVAAGDEVISAGTSLGPAHLGLLAALGERAVSVHRQPVVCVLSTGDELISDSGPLGEGKIRDANRPALLAMLQSAGACALDLGIVGDDEDAQLSAIEQACANSDAVVLSGGASHGDRDSIAAVLSKLAGVDNVRSFDVAIRPARPFVFAEIGLNHLPVFGLPGNPVAALVAFELMTKPVIRRLRGLPDRERPLIAGIAEHDFNRRFDGKLHFVRAIVHLDAEGTLLASPAPGQGAHMLASFAASNALVVLPDGTGAREGQTINLLLLNLDEL